MFSKIVVPVDGSPGAARAVAVAERLATDSHAEVAIVQVVELLAPGDREPGLISYADEHRIAVAQASVEQAASTLRLGRPVSAEVYLAADIVAGILARAHDLGADVIVMASRGQSWPEGGLLGSTAYQLLSEADLPVLLVGPRVPAAAAGLPAAGEASAIRP